jgi:chemotaxis protein MotA
MGTAKMANVSTTTGAGRRAAGSSAPPRTTTGPSLDPATLLGVAGGFALIIAAMVLGGTPGAFLDVPAMLIVLGGSFLITSVSFTVPEIVRAQSVMLKAVAYRQREPADAAKQMIYLADLARKHGALAMEHHEDEFRHEPFLRRAMNLVIDGTPGEEVERIMLREAEATMARHAKSAGVLRRAGEVAPAMGLIGTLVGLVQMLGNLQDPSAIGPAMAVALLTTFYGAVLANMVFLPLANKLERNSSLEAAVSQIYAQGTASIARQENPRRLETVLNTILPPADRVRYFD